MSIFNNLGQVKLGWRSSVVAQVQTSSLLLDTYSGATAAYSLRKLSGAYTGSAIRVRRSSDNTEQNIGFDGSGNLDTTSLLSFVGSGNGFVTTWYDQSGNSNNSSQWSASSQPQIVSSGSLINVNNKPSVYFNGSNSLRLNQIDYNNENFIIQVIKRNSTVDKSFALAYDGGGPGFFMGIWSDSKFYLQNRLNSYLASQNIDNDLNQMLLTGVGTTSQHLLYKNNSLVSTSVFTTDPIQNKANNIGIYYGSSNITKNNIQEIVIYNFKVGWSLD